MELIDYDFITAAVLSVSDALEEGWESSEDRGRVGNASVAFGPEALTPCFEKYGIDPDSMIEHVRELLSAMAQQGLITHPMGASIIATKFLTGVFLGMQMAKDRDERRNPEMFFNA